MENLKSTIDIKQQIRDTYINDLQQVQDILAKHLGPGHPIRQLITALELHTKGIV